MILAEGLIQGLDDIKLTAEDKYPINFTQPRERFVLSQQYNGSNSSLCVNATKIYEFKAKDYEIKDYALRLSNKSKDVTIHNLKKTGLKGSEKIFSLDFNPTDTNDILDIRRYILKGN